MAHCRRRKTQGATQSPAEAVRSQRQQEALRRASTGFRDRPPSHFCERESNCSGARDLGRNSGAKLVAEWMVSVQRTLADPQIVNRADSLVLATPHAGTHVPSAIEHQQVPTRIIFRSPVMAVAQVFWPDGAVPEVDLTTQRLKSTHESAVEAGINFNSVESLARSC